MVRNEKLVKEIKSKDQIINHLLVSLENLIRYPNRNAVIDETVTSPGLLETLPQSNQTGNSLETRKDIDFVKEIINLIPTKNKMMKTTTLAILYNNTTMLLSYIQNNNISTTNLDADVYARALV